MDALSDWYPSRQIMSQFVKQIIMKIKADKNN